ncbi:MAG TPA: LysR family transcriptional regulator [bacterium]|nr:LysR family transcriptional regulator [Myxococcales bacterium]OQA59181.1 MAG: HTH-type transcriptional regulator GltC [bacterium ADurb.Bin270]HPW45416.1 LysR family transcriptional regulator [bacterium]HQC51074.1 LysR family transcriptional regulator [bacterium]HQG13251.1 LysR family transcriptional regulator [bacterium]
MDIRKLEIFCEVYRQKGFSQAARKLGLTQSAVSQQIKGLESEIGVLLFDADDRSHPTAAGEYLSVEGGRIIAEISDLVKGVQAAGGIASGQIRFGMIDVAAIWIMPKVLKNFQNEHKNIRLDAVVRATGELVDLVMAHQIEFAVVVSDGLPDALEIRKIYADSIVAIVPKKFDDKGGVISVKDLKGEPLILYPPASHSRTIIDEAFRRNGMVPTVSMEMHYPAAICSLVDQGMGIGLISELSAKESRLEGQKIVKIEELIEARGIGVVWDKRRRLSPQARALISML